MKTPAVLTPRNAAEYLKAQGFPLSVEALAMRRARGMQPTFKRIGGRVIYRPEDLQAFLSGTTTA